VFRVEIIGPPIEKPSTLRSLAARDMPYATFAGAWDVASIGFTGRFVLQNIPILCNTIMLFHIDTCRLHPARARLSEGRLAMASAGCSLLHQLNEWEIASFFSHAAVRPNLLLMVRIYIRSRDTGEAHRGRDH